MQQEAANFIVNTLGLGEECEDYSGRGMYGKTTTGVTVECLDTLKESVETHLEEDNFSDYDEMQNEIENLVEIGVITEADEDERDTFSVDGELFKLAFRSDNMGLDYIVY